METSEKYLNPFTDFGFKKLFGSEPNKEFLIDFLNQILPVHHQIADLTYGNSEHQGFSADDRRIIIDIYCIANDGSRFIIEMQQASQHYFKDRALFYTSRIILDQGVKGKLWDYGLTPVYCIAIQDFVMEGNVTQSKMKSNIQLMDVETKEIFYEKLTFIFLEMPKFSKKEWELETDFDKWMFVLKNIHHLQKLPERLKNRIMTKFFEVAELAKLPAKERAAYEDSLKVYRDLHNTAKYAEDKGYALAEVKYKELAEEAIRKQEEAIRKQEEAILLLHSVGVEMETISEKLGIPIEKLQAILNKKS